MPEKTAVPKPAAKKAAPRKKAPKEPVKTPAKTRSAEKPVTHEVGDLISCLNVYPGSQLIFGKKSGAVYNFDQEDTVEYLLYEDLKAEALNRHSALVYEPMILIQDEAFLHEFPKVKERYETMYSTQELRSIILNNKVETMVNKIKSLPESALMKVKSVVSTLVENGDLDSLVKLNRLDELLGTEFSERG